MGQVRHGSAPIEPWCATGPRTMAGVRRQSCTATIASFASGAERGTRHRSEDGCQWRKRATVEDLKDGPERSALDGSDRGRRSGDRRIPASYAAAAGRLPPCPAAVHPAPDALGAAPVPAAMSH